MRKGIILLLMLLSLSAKSEVCENLESFTDFASKLTGYVLECKNVDAIKKTFKETLDYESICYDKSAILCEVIGTGMIDLAKSNIPEQWECNPVVMSRITKTLIVTACRNMQ